MKLYRAATGGSGTLRTDQATAPFGRGSVRRRTPPLRPIPISEHNDWLIAGSGSPTVKTVLVNALSAGATGRRQGKARRFLEGLSADELQYIAGCVGAFVLEHAAGGEDARWQIVTRLAEMERRRRPWLAGEALEDLDHKAILVLEYLGRCGRSRPSLVHAAHA